MMDVGWGELLLLAVVALFIFGPEKLPKAAADAGRLVRRLREMATKAQDEIGNHGIDVSGIKNDLRGVADLHPKRILGSAMSGLTDPVPGRSSATGGTADRPAASSASDPETGHPGPAAASGTGTSGSAARLDPDAT